MTSNDTRNETRPQSTVHQYGLVSMVSPVLPKNVFLRVKQEAQRLRPYAEALMPNPHSRYDHVKGKVLREQQSCLLKDVYYSDHVLNLVRHVSGEPRLMHMPIATDESFNINCKLNFYSDQTHLGWHYDRVDYQRGHLFVAVFTVWNTSSRTSKVLRTWSLHDGERQLALNENSMTIHDPKHVFHRVNTLPPKSSRCAMVMLFTTDANLPNAMVRHLNKVVFISRNAWVYAQYKLWHALASWTEKRNTLK